MQDFPEGTYLRAESPLFPLHWGLSSVKPWGWPSAAHSLVRKTHLDNDKLSDKLETAEV